MTTATSLFLLVSVITFDVKAPPTASKYPLSTYLITVSDSVAPPPANDSV